MKYYYINNNGDKVKYNGPVYNNLDGSYSGLLIKQVDNSYDIDLTYHSAIPSVPGYSSYYTYINKDGNEVKYTGNVKYSSNNLPYFTYTITEKVDLTKHDVVTDSYVYYTYTNDLGETVQYTGDVSNVRYSKRMRSYIVY